MKKRKFTQDSKKAVRTFAAMLKKAFAPLAHTGIAPPTASGITIDMPKGDYPCFGMEMDVTIEPGFVLPVSAIAIIRDERMEAELEAAATQIAYGVRWAWENRADLAPVIDAARPEIEEAISRACSQGLPLRLVGIGFARQDARIFRDREAGRHDQSPRIHAVVEALNDLLMPGNEDVVGWHGEHIASLIDNMLELQQIRCDRKKMLIEAGASGVIDAFTMQVMRAADADIAKALRELAASGCTEIDGQKVTGEDETLIISLATQSLDGLAQVAIKLSDQVRWEYDELIISELDLPATMICALHEQPVTKLVQHPMLLDDMIITDIVQKNRMMHVRVKMPTFYYNAESLRIWN